MGRVPGDRMTQLEHERIARWPVGGGEMRALVRRFDWTATPLGPIERWSHRQRAAIDMALSSPLKMLILWGPAGTVIYNDAFAQTAGDDHPHALGLPAVLALPSMAELQRN